MTDKFIPGAWLRDLAGLLAATIGPQTARFFYEEAARREAGEQDSALASYAALNVRSSGTGAGLAQADPGWDDAKPAPPADDLVVRLNDRESAALCNILRIQGAEKALRIKCRAEETSEYIAAAAIEALRAERDAHKQRADNHWETLRSIREIARTSGDLERIIQWVSDAGQGYTESAETTLSKEMDARKSAEARVAALEGLLDKYRAGIVTHVQMTGPVFGGTNSRQLKIAFEADQALAAGGADVG